MKPFKFNYLKPTISLAILLFSVSLMAQNGKVQGTVVDAENFKTIEAATVELLRKQDSSLVKGVITNQEGVYAFNNVANGEYLLRFSYLGYHKKVLPGFAITPEKQEVKFTESGLLPSSKKLEEVSVYGRMLTGTMEDDKTVYVITPQAADISQSGLDLLRQIPDVQVDFMTNAVTLEGSGNILFLLNGKKIDRSYLEQLNPNLIERYEIITNPGVKYESDVEGVINVILKKNINYGVSGRASVEIPTSDYGYFSNNNANLDFFKNGMRIYAGGYWGASKWDMYRDSEREYLDSEDNRQLNRYTRNNFKNTYGGFNYGFDWFINDKNTLNFYSSIRPRMPETSESFSRVYNISDGENGRDTIYELNKSNYRQDNLYNDYSLYYQRKFDKKGHEISGEAFFSDNNNFSSQSDTDLERSDSDPLDYNDYVTDNNKNILRLKADYNHPIGDKMKFSTGVMNFNSFIDNYYTPNAEYTNNLKYDEIRLAGYGNLSYKIKRNNLQAGIRYESSNIDIDYRGYNGDSTAASNYDEWLPFLSYQTKFGKRHSLRLNYRKSIRRPRMNQVNPFNIRNNKYQTSSGNAALDPAKVHRIEMSHRIKILGPMFINYKPFVRYEEDAIYNVSRTNGDIVEKKFENASEMLSYGVAINANLAAAKWWMISPFFRWEDKIVEEQQELGIKALHEDTWRLGIKSQIILPKDWVIFFDCKTSGKSYSHQTSRAEDNMLVAGFNKKINNRWSVSAYTLNPWRQDYTFNDHETFTDSYYESAQNYVNYNHIFNIRIKYSFNKGKEIKKLNRGVQGDEDASNGGGMF